MGQSSSTATPNYTTLEEEDKETNHRDACDNALFCLYPYIFVPEYAGDTKLDDLTYNKDIFEENYPIRRGDLVLYRMQLYIVKGRGENNHFNKSVSCRRLDAPNNYLGCRFPVHDLCLISESYSKFMHHHPWESIMGSVEWASNWRAQMETALEFHPYLKQWRDQPELVDVFIPFDHRLKAEHDKWKVLDRDAKSIDLVESRRLDEAQAKLDRIRNRAAAQGLDRIMREKLYKTPLRDLVPDPVTGVLPPPPSHNPGSLVGVGVGELDQSN
jgi:hypothetical protein